MNFGSILIILLAIIRFESTKHFIENSKNLTNDCKQVLTKLNTRSIISGFCMAMGFLLVANFRNSEGVFVQSSHNIGAVFGFFSTVTDMYFQSRSAHHMCQHLVSRVRFVLFWSSLVLAITYNLLSVVSFGLYSEALLDTELRLKWNTTQSGYAFHVTSTVLEWILIFSLSPYFLTFVSQLKKYSLSKRIVIFKDFNDNSIDPV